MEIKILFREPQMIENMVSVGLAVADWERFYYIIRIMIFLRLSRERDIPGYCTRTRQKERKPRTIISWLLSHKCLAMKLPTIHLP
ncbi:hypothetical protein TNCV_390581 [Trichonephila clavipes]|nr:hypothetical protein TNCV_390581 [Trichonephila clavipes]